MAEVLNSEHLRTNPASSPQDCEFEVLTTLWLCLLRTVHKHKLKVSILCRFPYGEILLYVSDCKLWSGSVQNSVNIINWMICDLQAIAPLTDAAKRIQEAEESGKTLLEVCLIHMHYWPNMRSICLDVGQVIFEEQDWVNVTKDAKKGRPIQTRVSNSNLLCCMHKSSKFYYNFSDFGQIYNFSHLECVDKNPQKTFISGQKESWTDGKWLYARMKNWITSQ